MKCLPCFKKTPDAPMSRRPVFRENSCLFVVPKMILPSLTLPETKCPATCLAKHRTCTSGFSAVHNLKNRPPISPLAPVIPIVFIVKFSLVDVIVDNGDNHQSVTEETIFFWFFLVFLPLYQKRRIYKVFFKLGRERDSWQKAFKNLP